jgi:hypothetical protein
MESPVRGEKPLFTISFPTISFISSFRCEIVLINKGGNNYRLLNYGSSGNVPPHRIDLSKMTILKSRIRA